MPRVHTQVARADIYREGLMVPDPKTKSGKRRDRSQPANKQDEIIVKAGTTYYWWKFRYGGKIISTTYPKQSQLTQSDFLSQIYSIQEDMDAASVGDFSKPSDLESWREEKVGELESLRDECEEKRSNMPEQLQDSGSGEILQSRYDSLDEMIDELNGVSLDDYEEPEWDDFVEEKSEELELPEDADESGYDTEFTDFKREKFEEWAQERLDELQGITYNGE